MMELIEQSRTEEESGNIFEVLSSEYSVDELEIRQDPNGLVLVQDPSGETASVSSSEDGLEVQKVNAGDVEFKAQEEIEDVFGDNVVAE